MTNPSVMAGKTYEAVVQGLVIAGFPSNDFAGQEPGTNDEIQAFCTGTFGVQFPLFDKIPVVGESKHPLYAALVAAQPKAVSTGSAPFADKLRKYGIDPNPEPESYGTSKSSSSAVPARSSSATRPTPNPQTPSWSRPSSPNWRRPSLTPPNRAVAPPADLRHL